MTARLAAAVLALALSACDARPGPHSAVVNADPQSISFRSQSTWESEMDQLAARHCAQYGKQPRPTEYRREDVRTDRLYASYRCI